MQSKPPYLAALIAVVVWFVTTAVPLEASPSLVNIGVGTRGKVVVTNARLVGGFTDSIVDAIESGVPITFTFQVELRQENDLWNDTLISTNTVNHTVKYDSLKKVYRFSEFGKGVRRKISTRNREGYQRLMLTLNDIPIAPIKRLASNEKYYVRIKADLETDRFWFPFNHLFFFLPFNNFDAAWAESSPLSIAPDLAFARDESSDKTQRRYKKEPGGTNNDVVRSFNK